MPGHEQAVFREKLKVVRMNDQRHRNLQRRVPYGYCCRAGQHRIGIDGHARDAVVGQLPHQATGLDPGSIALQHPHQEVLRYDGVHSHGSDVLVHKAAPKAPQIVPFARHDPPSRLDRALYCVNAMTGHPICRAQ